MQPMPLLPKDVKHFAYVLWISTLDCFVPGANKMSEFFATARTHSHEEATDFSPKLLMSSTQHLKVPLTNIHEENIQGPLQSCCENGKQVEQGGNTILQPLPKLILQRYHSLLHFRPEAW